MSRAIDADAMLARLEEWNTSDSTDKALYNFTLHRILEQPTIELRKKGKWINHRCDGSHHIADCDQCGHSLQWFDDDIPKYCCECGAEMGEPEDIPMEYFESGGR